MLWDPESAGSDFDELNGSINLTNCKIARIVAKFFLG